MNTRTIIETHTKMLSQRQRMSPFPNYFSMEAMCRELQKYVGVKLPSMLLLFEDRVMWAFLPSKKFDAAGEKIVRHVERNPNLYRALVRAQDRCGKQLVTYAKKAARLVNTKTSAQQLFRMVQQYERLYKQVYAIYGSVWVMETPLNARLYKIIAERVDDTKRVSTMLDTLTKQPSAMVARIEREALLALAMQLSKRWDDKFIQKHERRFFWLTRDYEDPVLTFDMIVTRVKEVMKKNPKKEHQAMVEEMRELARDRTRYTKELRLTKKEQQLFASMRDAAHLKELRKRYVSESLYHFDAVLAEIARRTFLTIKQVRFLRTEDVRRALVDREDMGSVAGNRITFSVWFSNTSGTTITTGAKAEIFRRRFIAHDPNAKEFKGLPVSPGIARGRVKIVLNPNECGKVEKGDIIVSIQVVPSFSPAIHRAAGLICDGGHGITSHPAVLSREAGIPAIIQTRFAREVLKDGDMVEVDGYKGIARKL